MKICKVLAGLVACVSCLSWAALGQGVIAPPPLDYSGLSPGLRTAGTNAPGLMPLPSAVAQPEKPLLQLGPATFHPHLLYRFLYGDGIPASPGVQAKTAINEIYPGVFIAVGTHWNLDYTPALRFYTSSKFRDTLDHAVTLSWGSAFEDWTLGFSQGYSSSSQPLVETASQTDEEVYPTTLSARYQINTALSLELEGSQYFRFRQESTTAGNLTDSRTWSTLDWLNYQFSPKIGAAIGIGFSFDDVSIGTDMTSEQMQGRVTWRPGEKLFLSASVGFEDRQFLDSNQPNALNPIFGLSAAYHILEPTTLSVGAYRTVTPSYFANELTEAVAVTAGLHQRLLGKLYLDLTGGFTKTTYTGTATGFEVNREDNGTFFDARLSLLVLRRGTVAVIYHFSDNTSNEPGFDYSSQQAGIELGYRF